MNKMLYELYELNSIMMVPAHMMANATHKILSHPLNSSHMSEEGRTLAAGWEFLERVTRRFAKPEFGIHSVKVASGTDVKIQQKTVKRDTFCKLLHFERVLDEHSKSEKPSHELKKILIVAPLSGHYATLLRDTVHALLQDHDVYITDWANARDVPLFFGRFDLDDYIDYVIRYIQLLGPQVNVVAVCQPSVPVMAATALMASRQDPMAPRSVTLMGGPIDTRINPTKVNDQAKNESIEWFEQNIIADVPWYYPGALRRVCPGFIMLSGFMSMNLERHMEAHKSFYNHLVQGDESGAEGHRKFYDEFLAVLDMPAEYYLQSVNTVFQRHALPKGTMKHRDEKVDLKAIEKTALLTIEGERDDISGVGQTKAAQALCKNIPADRKMHYEQKAVGHYGIFNGRKWRANIMPKIADFLATIK
jgi:poly(3-hydroxybutyrate) depolymerase